MVCNSCVDLPKLLLRRFKMLPTAPQTPPRVPRRNRGRVRNGKTGILISRLPSQVAGASVSFFFFYLISITSWTYRGPHARHPLDVAVSDPGVAGKDARLRPRVSHLSAVPHPGTFRPRLPSPNRRQPLYLSLNGRLKRPNSQLDVLHHFSFINAPNLPLRTC